MAAAICGITTSAITGLLATGGFELGPIIPTSLLVCFTPASEAAAGVFPCGVGDSATDKAEVKVTLEGEGSGTTSEVLAKSTAISVTTSGCISSDIKVMSAKLVCSIPTPIFPLFIWLNNTCGVLEDLSLMLLLLLLLLPEETLGVE